MKRMETGRGDPALVHSTGTYWNVLRLDDARAFTKLLMANKCLEVGISIEGDSYSFTINCTGFRDLFQRCYDSLLPEPKTIPVV